MLHWRLKNILHRKRFSRSITKEYQTDIKPFFWKQIYLHQPQNRNLETLGTTDLFNKRVTETEGSVRKVRAFTKHLSWPDRPMSIIDFILVELLSVTYNSSTLSWNADWAIAWMHRLDSEPKFWYEILHIKKNIQTCLSRLLLKLSVSSGETATFQSDGRIVPNAETENRLILMSIQSILNVRKWEGLNGQCIACEKSTNIE